MTAALVRRLGRALALALVVSSVSSTPVGASMCLIRAVFEGRAPPTANGVRVGRVIHERLRLEAGQIDVGVEEGRSVRQQDAADIGGCRRLPTGCPAAGGARRMLMPTGSGITTTNAG